MIKSPIIIIKKLPALGMAIFPFILLKNKELKTSKYILNHEKIHLRQQLELLILPFYLLYLIFYLVNYIKYKNHDKAYRNIAFEQEAYLNDENLDYLKTRSWYAWLRMSAKNT